MVDVLVNIQRQAPAVDVLVPRSVKQSAVFKVIPQERFSRGDEVGDLAPRLSEHVVVPLKLVPERVAAVSVLGVLPQERVPGCTGELIIDLPVPQIMESVEVMNSSGVARAVPSERFPEQIDDVIKVSPPEGGLCTVQSSQLRQLGPLQPLQAQVASLSYLAPETRPARLGSRGETCSFSSGECYGRSFWLSTCLGGGRVRRKSMQSWASPVL